MKATTGFLFREAVTLRKGMESQDFFADFQTVSDRNATLSSG
ncbi:MAG: hypothetical protein AAGE37_11200 [Pseudomonadota bacterium]